MGLPHVNPLTHLYRNKNVLLACEKDLFGGAGSEVVLRPSDIGIVEILADGLSQFLVQF